jgi:site-specific DNA-methyltransferase (adenine-specific)
MKIQDIDVEKLIPYVNNPRHNAEAVDYVAASIREFGFKVPIVVDKNLTIVTGHTRVLAAKKLGLEKVPCIMADDLTDQQIKAFRLADNKVGEFSGWDFEKLEIELEALGDLEMTEFGFYENGGNIDDFFEDQKKDESQDPPKYQIIIECATEDERETVCELLEANGVGYFKK